MTNEEWFKSLSTKELACRLAGLTGYSACGVPYYGGPDSDHISYEEAKKEWLDWLKKERTDDERREAEEFINEGVIGETDNSGEISR